MIRDAFATLSLAQTLALLAVASLATGLVLGVTLRALRDWRDRRWLWSGRYKPDDRDALDERAERIERSTINASARQEPR